MILRSSAFTQRPCYLYELLVCFIHLAEDAGSVFHKVPDGIHMVEGHKKDVFRARTQQDLILECHGHQIIELGIKIAQNELIKKPFHHIKHQREPFNTIWLVITQYLKRILKQSLNYNNFSEQKLLYNFGIF